MIDERSQSPWGTKVALYMFFEGAGAAAWLLVFFLGLLSRLSSLFILTSLFTAVALVLVGVVCLWLDLGRKDRFYWAMSSLNRSWISRGTFMVILFLVLSVAYILISVWPSPWLREAYMVKRVLEGMSVLTAAAITVYPGLLLKSCKPFKLWDSPLIIVLSVVLSLLSGVAVTLLVVSSVALGSDTAARSMALLQVGLGLSGGLVLGSTVTFIIHLAINYGMGGLARVSVLRLLQGNLSSQFIFATVSGWILPLVLIFPAFSADGTGRVLLSAISAISLLVGSFLLRHLLLVAPLRDTVPDIPFISAPK
jgi:formate-dependent nitrite reductase membrane component NrfD